MELGYHYDRINKDIFDPLVGNDLVREYFAKIDPHIIPTITTKLLGSVFVNYNTSAYVYYSKRDTGKDGVLILVGYNKNGFAIPEPRKDDLSIWYNPYEVEYHYKFFEKLNDCTHFIYDNISVKMGRKIASIFEEAIKDKNGIPYLF